MAFDGKSNVRFVDFSEEPLGWPADDTEELIDISSVRTLDLFRDLSADDSLGPTTAVTSSTGERTLNASDNVDSMFSNMEALSVNIGSGELGSHSPHTYTSVPETMTFASTSSPSPTICIVNPEGIQVPFQTHYDRILESSNKKLKFVHQPPLTRPKHDPHKTCGSPDVVPHSHQHPDTPADNCVVSFPNTIDRETTADCMAVDRMGAITSPVPYFNISLPGLTPTSANPDTLSHHFLNDSEYVTGGLSLYNNFSVPGPKVNRPQSTLSFSPSTPDHLDLTSFGTDPRFPNSPSSLNEFTYDTPQADFTPFLDLQTQRLGRPPPGLSSLNDQSVYHPLGNNNEMMVMDVEAPTTTPPINEGPIVSISRSSRRRPSPTINKNIIPNSRPLYTYSPSPAQMPERTTRSSPSADPNSTRGEFNVSEDHSLMKTSAETYVRTRPIIPVTVRRDTQKTAGGTPAPKTPLRRSKSSQSQRHPKKYYFRPICPSSSYRSGSSSSPSPSSSPSAVNLTHVNSPQLAGDVLPSITNSVPGSNGTSFTSAVSNGEARYLVDIPFNTLVPTSEVEVAHRITGVAFSDLKRLQFAFGPASEILEDPDSRPFSNYHRMTELYVLVEWTFPLGLKESNHLHKIAKLERPINNFRRVEILCKIAGKLYEYIQKEKTIPLDPKKLCLLSLCQQLDKKWIVKIGLNNSEHI